jgi:Spy/CpxP family protein refolding chaperone
MISTLALVFAASTFAALAQDATPTPTPNPQARHEGHRWGGGPGGPMMKEALDALTPAEREQLKAARQKASSDQAVVEARKNAEAAQKSLREAEKAAMLKADPTIGPVLEKMEAAMKAHRPHHQDGEAPAPAPES